jgi:uncharacterized protein YkwD
LTPSANAASPKLDRAEHRALRLINAYRAEHGLPKLRVNKRLNRTAHWMARDMGRYNYFSHDDRFGRSPFQRLDAFGYRGNDLWRGENLAAGLPDAVGTVTQWRNSPTHDANLLRSNFRAAGIARVRAPEGASFDWYWALEFGSHRYR